MDFLRAGIKSVVGSQESQNNQANGIETVSIIVCGGLSSWKIEYMGLRPMHNNQLSAILKRTNESQMIDCI